MSDDEASLWEGSLADDDEALLQKWKDDEALPWDDEEPLLSKPWSDDDEPLGPRSLMMTSHCLPRGLMMTSHCLPRSWMMEMMVGIQWKS